MTSAAQDPAGEAADVPRCDRLSPDDQIEWALFFERHYSKLVKACLVRGSTIEDAEDAADTAMLETRRRWTHVANRDAYARRVAINYVTRQQKNRREEATKFVEKGLHVVHDHTDAQLTEYENIEWIKQLLDCLPPAQRAVMEALCIGLSLAEIAEYLGKEPATVRKHLQLARLRLTGEVPPRRTQARPGRSAPSTGKEN